MADAWAYLQEHWWFGTVTVSFIFAALTSGHVVLRKNDPRAAMLWLGLLWLTPFLGVVLYWTIGVNRVSRKAKRRDVHNKSSLVSEEHLGTPVTNFAAEKNPQVLGNSVVPLENGDQAYPEMLTAIREAKSTVLLTSYIFDNDKTGKEFAEALGEAVRRGVDVRVIVDSVGARYSFPSIVSELKGQGVPVARFLPTTWPWKLRYANMRSHRKIMVVDGVFGFTGGMNIRHDCVLNDSPDYPTSDIHFAVRGPVVLELTRVILEDWAFCTGETVSDEKFSPTITSQGTVAVRAVVDGPDNPADPISWTKQARVSRALRSVKVMTPYFVPGEAVLSSLITASLNGADVKIVLPKTNNLRMVDWAQSAIAPRLLERGVRIFYTQGPFNHSKLLRVDDDWTAVGSANWDARSFRLNFEFDLECVSTEFASTIDQVFARHLDNARELTLDETRDTPMFYKLRNGIAHLGAPYL